MQFFDPESLDGRASGYNTRDLDESKASLQEVMDEQNARLRRMLQGSKTSEKPEDSGFSFKGIGIVLAVLAALGLIMPALIFGMTLILWLFQL